MNDYGPKYWKTIAKQDKKVFFNFEVDFKHVPDRCGKFKSCGILTEEQGNLLRHCFDIIQDDCDNVQKLIEGLRSI